jgi:hypothetical protein
VDVKLNSKQAELKEQVKGAALEATVPADGALLPAVSGAAKETPAPYKMENRAARSFAVLPGGA